jgi:hypothetical protein
MLKKIIKSLLKLLRYSLGFIAICGVILFSFYLFANWKSNQHYEEEVTFYCWHKFIDCANENIDFEVIKVKGKNFFFLEKNMVTLRWKNIKKLEELRKNKTYLNSEFEVKGIVYKYKLDAAVSRLYDCKLEAYKVDVIEMKQIVN